MTAADFLRSMALRAEVANVVPSGVTDPEDIAACMEPELVIRIDPYDAEEFLSLTGVRVE